MKKVKIDENNQLYLIFVNKIGSNVFGQSLYEFVFSKDINDVQGEDWDIYPANGSPQPPYKKHIEKVGSVKTDKFELEVIQDSSFFGMGDCQDNIISLAWEILLEEDNDDIKGKRLIFNYGESEDSVINKLYIRNITFENKKL